jgi:hypothetical protein
MGMWSTSRSTVAYYSDEALSLNSSRDFTAMPGAKKNRFRMGLNEDPARSRARRPQGFLCVRKFCAPKFDFGNCQFRNLVGRALRGCCLRAAHVGGELPAAAVMEVAEFAEPSKPETSAL